MIINNNFAVKIEVSNKVIEKELERIVIDEGGFNIHHQSEQIDLLIYELKSNSDEELEKIQSFLESNTVTEVFVTSKNLETELLLRLMRTGAKEFFALPLDENIVKKALSAFKKKYKNTTLRDSREIGKIINVIGAKGGVGTTTVAVNLAMFLAEKEKTRSIALVDFNTIFGEIPLFLSVKQTYHWGQIFKNVHRLDSTFLMNALAKHSSGVYILPSPSILNGYPHATPEVMENLLNAMRTSFNYVIVDGGQSMENPALKAIEMSDYIFIITLLSLPCVNNTNNLIKSLENAKVIQKDQLKLIINRFIKNSDISIKEAEDSFNSQIFWKIPNDYKTSMSAINRGKPLYEVSPRAGITKSISGLADTLITGTQKAEKKGWLFFGR